MDVAGASTSGAKPMNRRTFLITAGSALGATGLVLTGCTTTRPDAPADHAARRNEIDSGADGTLTRLYSSVRGARDLGGRAQGMLIFPRVLSGGLGVGGEYGDGVLRTGGRPDGYYRGIGGSFGWQIGGQSQADGLMFLPQEAPEPLRHNQSGAIGA